MQLLVLEVGSCQPVTAHIAVNFNLRTLVLNMTLDALESLYAL